MAIGYKVTVSGQYRAVTERGKVIKPFRNLEFIIPEQTTYSPGRKKIKKMVNGHPIETSIPLRATVNSLRIVKSLLAGRFLPDKLRELHDDYASLREFEIMSQVRIRVDDHLVRDFTKVKIRDMTAPELNQFHALHDLNCVLGSYSTLSDKKVAVEREYQARVAKDLADAEDRNETESLTEPQGVMVLEEDPRLAVSPSGGGGTRKPRKGGAKIQEMSGAVTSSDGVPVDEQDPAASLL